MSPARTISLPTPASSASAGPDYRRPPLRWITRRARCWLSAFPLEVKRRDAIRFAAIDYAWFTGARSLTLIQGGRSHG